MERRRGDFVGAAIGFADFESDPSSDFAVESPRGVRLRGTVFGSQGQWVFSVAQQALAASSDSAQLKLTLKTQ